MINSRDKILFNFLIKYLRKTKKLNEIIIIIFKRIKIIHKNLILNQKIKHYQNKLQIFIPKIFSFLIMNSAKLFNIFRCNNPDDFITKLFLLIKVYYLNNLLDNESLLNIIRIKLYACFYDEENYNIEELKSQVMSNKSIINISHLETIIKFLLSFTEENISQKNILEFNKLINNVSKLITDLFLANYNNIFLLSNS